MSTRMGERTEETSDETGLLVKLWSLRIADLRRSGPQRGRPTAPADTALLEGAGPAQTMTWTGGSAWATRAATAALWGAVVCGPLALGAWAMTGHQPPVAVAVPTAVGVDRAQIAVGDYAAGAVLAWLRSSRDQDLSSDFFPGSDQVGTQVPWSASDPVVADTDQVSVDQWSVTIGVDVRDPGQDPASPATRRYFQVPVRYQLVDGVPSMTAQALPAPVAGPGTVTTSGLSYSQQVAATSSAGAAVTSFLTALLTGQGEIGRYTSPGSSIAAISPAPYGSLELTKLTAGTGADSVTGAAGEAAPADGDAVEVLADAVVTSGGQRLPVTYALQLLARGGRWEIAVLRSTPITTVTSGAAATSTGAPAVSTSAPDSGATAQNASPAPTG